MSRKENPWKGVWSIGSSADPDAQLRIFTPKGNGELTIMKKDRAGRRRELSVSIERESLLELANNVIKLLNETPISINLDKKRLEP